MINLDYVDPVVLTGFVRNVPTEANFTLNQFLPDVYLGDIEAAWDELVQTNRAAKFRAWDAETPIGKRDYFERRRVEMPPISQKTVIGEYERLNLERLRAGGDNRNRMVTAIYNEAATNVRAVRARMELARGSVLSTGRFTLSENGLQGIEADFGIPGSQLVTAGVLWSDHANSDPIMDLRAWVDQYIDNGGTPGQIVTSRQVVGDLTQNLKIRQLASSMAGTPSMITRAILNNVMDANDLPPITTYNTQIDVDGVATRPMPANKLSIVPANPRDLGITAWGITAEALELAGQQNPGIAFQDLPGLVGVVMKDGDPVRVWTKVSGTGMPLITNGRRLLVATVR